MENKHEQQLLSQGKEMFQKNALSKAQKFFEEALEINPESTDAYFFIGNIFLLLLETLILHLLKKQ